MFRRCLVSNSYRTKPKASSPILVKIVSSASEVEAGKIFPPYGSLVAKKITIFRGETLTLECSALDSEDVRWTFSPSFTSTYLQLLVGNARTVFRVAYSQVHMCLGFSFNT